MRAGPDCSLVASSCNVSPFLLSHVVKKARLNSNKMQRSPWRAGEVRCDLSRDCRGYLALRGVRASPPVVTPLMRQLKRDRSGQAIKWRCTFLNTPPKFLLPAGDNVGSSVKHRTDISGLHDLIFGGCLKRRNTCSQISTWTPKRC